MCIIMKQVVEVEFETLSGKKEKASLKYYLINERSEYNANDGNDCNESFCSDESCLTGRSDIHDEESIYNAGTGINIRRNYGIAIVMEGTADESSVVKNISCKKEKVEKLLKILVSNTVTPCDLPYVLDNVFAEDWWYN